jgi:hypothetical protein
MKSIYAKLAQRFVFNFRLGPATVAAIIGSDRLSPQLIKGWAVGSFCILELRDIGFGSIPNPVGPSSVNCSYRYGAIDKETGEHCVYVEERCTNSRLGSWLTSLGFPGFHPYVKTQIDAGAHTWRIDAQGPVSFSAEVNQDAFEPGQLFEDETAFEKFMANGVRSFCPATDTTKMNIVDLEKSDSTFESLSCNSWKSDRFEEEELDSVYRTVGGRYKWTFVGQVDRSLKKS